MPAKGEFYKHKQITDERYKVDAIDKDRKVVYLKSTNGRGERIPVTFTQLASSYVKD